MKQKYILDYIKESIGDGYAMEVLYFTFKNAVKENDYSLKDVSYVDIDGRFHGETIRVGTRMRYRSALHAISLLLSVRALMLNDKYLSCCENDHLIFTSIPKEKFQWIENTTIIFECMEDDEFAMIYGILEDLYFDDDLTDKDKELFEHSINKPDFRNTNLYYRNIASNCQGVQNEVICDNAFVCESFTTYEIGEEIKHIGNTAFAYCNNLETLEFKGQVTFGKFPIIECEKLRRIIVPFQFIDYYRQMLPYYKGIIFANKNSVHNDFYDKPFIENVKIDNLDIEIVYVDIPSADPYTEIEIDNDDQFAQKQDVIIDTSDIKRFEKVFDKKATSYKYFWWIAIITLAKDKGTLVIPFKNIIFRMAALAWPIVFNDEINLGGLDQLSRYLRIIQNNSTLLKSASSNRVEDYLRKYDDTRKFSKVLFPLLKNVPYRFLSPWIVFTDNDDVANKTRDKSYTGPYTLYDDHLELSKNWWDYIQSHLKDIRDFTLQSFITYAKKYNNEIKLSRLEKEGWDF